MSKPVQTKFTDYACRLMKSCTDDCIIVNLWWILRLKLSDTEAVSGWLIQSPSKRQHTFALISSLQWSRWYPPLKREKTHKRSLQMNNSTGRRIMHPISKYMTFNYPRIVCFVVSAQPAEVLYNKEPTTKQNKQTVVNETSQRCFYQRLHHSLTCSPC